MAEHTPTPWDWLIHDHSMASLGVMPDPGLGDPLVLCVSPCQGCMDRAEPREWKWGRCHTPSEADADFIVLAVNNHDRMVATLEALRDDPAVPPWIQTLARGTLSGVGGSR